jgi:hypothetical protein
MLTDALRGFAYLPTYYINILTSKRQGVFYNADINKAREKYLSGASGGINIIKSPSPPFYKKIFHGLDYGVSSFTTPFMFFVDGFGSPIWTNLSRRTMLVFRNEDQFEDENKNEDHQGAAAIFIEEYIKHSSASSTSDDLKLKYNNLNLVGHSMGAIVINNALSFYGDELKEKIQKIIFMAPACSAREWETTTLKYLEKNPACRFYNLTLDPTREKEEINCPIFVPTGSLLEWVDRFYGNPENITNRMFGKYVNFINTTSIIPPNVQNQITLKVFPYEKSKSALLGKNPIMHGMFSKVNFWKPELLQ